MNKLIFITSIMFCFLLKINCQNRILDSTITSLKKYDLDKAIFFSSQLKGTSKEIFNNWINYYQKGENLDLINFNNKNNSRIYNLSKLSIGDYFLYQKKQDSIAFKHYVNVKISAIVKKDTLLINESLRRICELQIKFRNFKLYKETLSLLNKYKSDSIDYYYVNYFKIAETFFNSKKPNLNNNNNNNFLTAKLLNIKGVYFSRINEYQNSIENYQNAIKNFNKYESYYTNYFISGIKFNIAIILYKSKKYEKAIFSFKKLLKEDFKNDVLRKKSINQWLYKCYDSIKKPVIALKYLKESIKLNEQLSSNEHSKFILNKEHQLKLYEKKTELENEIRKSENLNSKIITILPIFVITIVLLAIVSILYKKHHKKSKTLEEEKFETIKKIDELKEIVIKNHIVLKDKTKVYIADLLYIKSEGHYLKIYLSNGKNHFVRGKLYKIVEKLPPNFIRCHRSYVVNRNFIKQINNTFIILVDKTEIPLARTYKDKI